jgi:hypothetical protein
MSFPKFSGDHPKVWKDKCWTTFVCSMLIHRCGLFPVLCTWRAMLLYGCKHIVFAMK